MQNQEKLDRIQEDGMTIRERLRIILPGLDDTDFEGTVYEQR